MLGNTMGLLMREAIATEKEIQVKKKKKLKKICLTERKVAYFKSFDPGHALRTAHQTNSQFLSFPQSP